MLLFNWTEKVNADGPSNGDPKLCSLDHVAEAMRAEVVKVDGGREVNRRLAQLGIYLGTVLQVKQSAPLGGPILIEAGGTTVAVGRGLARKILVRPLP